MSLSFRLAEGLATDRAHRLGALLGDILGAPPFPAPWLAATLLLSDPKVREDFPMPRAGAGQVLIHDYQSIAQTSELPLDRPLQGAGSVTRKGSTTEIDISLGESIAMKTALRLVAAEDLASARAMPVRFAEGAETVTTRPITQADVDTYLELSGDPNPLHQDSGAAEAIGLSAPVVPGLLLAGLGQIFRERSWPGASLLSLRARFSAPVLVGQSVSITAMHRGDRRLRIFVHQGGLGAAITDVTLG